MNAVRLAILDSLSYMGPFSLNRWLSCWRRYRLRQHKKRPLPEDLTTGILITRCKHIFHKRCLWRWLALSAACHMYQGSSLCYLRYEAAEPKAHPDSIILVRESARIVMSRKSSYSLCFTLKLAKRSDSTSSARVWHGRAVCCCPWDNPGNETNRSVHCI
jgi:hypothetical protein